MISGDVLAANRLIQSCGKAGDLVQARGVFDGLGETRNLYSWVLISTAYARNGHVEEAIRLFDCMPLHSTVAYRAALSFLAKSRKADEVHKFFFGRIPDWDLVSYNTLLSAYGQSGEIESVQKLYMIMEERDLITYTAMLAAFCNAGDMVSAERVFLKMPERDFVAWNSMLTTYVQFGHIASAKRLFYSGMKEWNLACCNAMLSAYGSRISQENFEGARELFTCGMKEHNLLSWNSMLTIYSHCGYIDEAKFLYDTMPERSIVSSTALLAVYVSNNRIVEATDIFHGMKVLDLVSSTVMICGFARNGNENDARQIFQLMEHCDIFTMNALLDVYAQKGQTEELLYMFYSRMPEWNIVSFNTVLYAFLQHQKIEDVKQFFDFMQERDTISWNILVCAYSQHGHIQMAEEIFHSMTHRDLITWNTLLSGYVLTGEMHKANCLFSQMPVQDLSSWNSVLGGTKSFSRSLALLNTLNLVEMPDEVTFISILHLCNHLGNVKDAWSHFCSITTDYFLNRTKQHYRCMIDLLGRSGYLSQAKSLMTTMPFPPESTDWTLVVDKNQ